MQTLEITSNAMNVVGFLCLASSRSFADLYWYWKGKLGIFGQMRHYVGDRGIWDTWEFKYAQPTGIFLLFLGNAGLLIVSVFS